MALLTVLKGKIHRATVTFANLHYEGSITIDPHLLEASGVRPYEQVDVLNIHNGERFTTYAIEGERGSGEVGINGAAARLAQKGDLVIVCAYVMIRDRHAESHKPKLVYVDERNCVVSQG
jgi:aspartate 1-decarboxylase